MRYIADATAIIDSPSHIGDDTRIWHFCHVCAWATIGKDCALGQNVYIGPGVEIGNRVRIQNNVSVYAGVTIEDDVFLGPSCVFTNVKFPRAGVSVHGAFDKTIVKKGATIGANATIVCGVTIGEFSFIGAGAVVTKDVGPGWVMVGNPARRLRRVRIPPLEPR